MKEKSRNIHYDLIVNLKEGSYSAFNQIYEIYADMLYNFVLGLTKSPSEAKDVVQDTFLKIWQNKHSLSPDLSFKSYLYTIAKNQIIDTFHKQIDNVSFDTYMYSGAYLEKSENNVEINMNYDEFMVKLKLAKNKMTDKQRKIFELNKEQGYTIDEIATMLDLSSKTIRNTLSLSLKILRAEIPGFSLLIALYF